MIVPDTWDWMEEMPGENTDSFSIEDVLSEEDKKKLDERRDEIIKKKHEEQIGNTARNTEEKD